MRWCLAVLFCLFAFVFAGAKSGVIEPGDRLSLTCLEEPSLNRDYPVTSDGLILMNYLGAVKVGGLTVEQAERLISERLVADRIVRTATVKLAVPRLSNLKVSVRGAVEIVGELPFQVGMKLSQALAAAKPNEQADLSQIAIQPAQGSAAVYDISKPAADGTTPDPALNAGDEIFVPVKVVLPPAVVTIEGAVANPGEYKLEPGMTLRQLVEKAGGYLARADRLRIGLQRTGAAPSDFDASGDADLTLQSGDRISVPIQVIRYVVTIDGAVQRPGRLEYTDTLTLSQAVREAGGLAEWADARRVAIFNPGQTEKPRIVNLDDISRGYTGDVVLEPGQRIEVAGGRRDRSRTARLAAGAAVLLFILGR